MYIHKHKNVWYWWRCNRVCPSEGYTSRPLLVSSLIASLFYPLFPWHCTLPITLEMGKINNYLLHFLSFIFTENTGDDIFETLNLNIFWWSTHPEPLNLERLRRLKFSSGAHTFKISHNVLDYRYLIANEIIAKGRKKRKTNYLKTWSRMGWGGGAFKILLLPIAKGVQFLYKVALEKWSFDKHTFLNPLPPLRDGGDRIGNVSLTMENEGWWEMKHLKKFYFGWKMKKYILVI